MKTLIKQFLILSLLWFNATMIQAEIVINETREFIVDENTIINLDGEAIDAATFENKANGMTAIVLVGDDANSSVTSGTANKIDAFNLVKGPVTSIDPLQVFGQNIFMGADTVLANTDGTFSIDELLEISGNFDDASNILATRIESKSTIDVWKLISHVTSVVGDDVGFGLLTVSITGVTLNDCDAGVIEGGLVEIKTASINDFSIENTLDSISKFECKNGLVDIPDDTTGAIIGFELEGYVTTVTDETHFELNSQIVELSNNVIYKNGVASDLVLGVKLEAEGTYNTDTEIFTALKIDFKQTKARIEAPVSIENLMENEIIIMGISGQINSMTEDKDDLLENGMSEETQIEVRGYVDSSGELIVEEFRERGNPDLSDTRLRGPVSSVDDNGFEILGVQIDTTGAIFFDNQNLSITEEEFLAALFIGALVDSHHGSYEAQNNQLIGGELTLEFNVTANMNKQSSLNQKVGASIGAVALGKIDLFVPAKVAAPVQPEVSENTSDSGGGSLFVLSILILLGILKRKF